MSMSFGYHRDGFSFQGDARGKLVDPGDEKLIVAFYSDAVEDVGASKREGRPIYRDVVFVRIQIPGDRDLNVIERPAEDKDKARFPRQWERYQRGEAVSTEGTPLEVWPIMTKGLVKMLKAQNIATVEQLANVDDSNLRNLGIGAREMRDRAKAYLEDAADGARADKDAREKAALQQQIDALEARLALLGAPPAAGAVPVTAAAPVTSAPETPMPEVKLALDAPNTGMLNVPRRGPGRPPNPK